MIHGLFWGGSLTRSNPVFEGDPPGSDTHTAPVTYLPQSPTLNRELCALHCMARQGVITTDNAERQINKYLLAASYLKRHPDFPHPKMLLISLSDAPQLGTVPDMGGFIRHVFSRRKSTLPIHHLCENAIPSFRQNNHAVIYDGVLAPVLNTVLGMLLGVFPDVLRKPSFDSKQFFFARVHSLLTSPKADQSAFCTQHHHIVLFAVMEYLARVLPLYFPVEHRFLLENTTMEYFFERVPCFGDEVRQFTDTTRKWSDIDAQCKHFVEKISRLKRLKQGLPPRKLKHVSSTDMTLYWNIPVVRGLSTPEHAMFCAELCVDGAVMRSLHSLVQIHRLPHNIVQLQYEAWAECKTQRHASMCTKMYFCTNCIAHRDTRHELRVDIHTSELTCALCQKRNIICVETLG